MGGFKFTSRMFFVIVRSNRNFQFLPIQAEIRTDTWIIANPKIIGYEKLIDWG